MKEPSYLIRTGKREHMESLLNWGEVYMSSLSFFAKGGTKNEAKDDNNEGRWADSCYVQIGENCEMFKAENLRHTGYIYCFTGFTDDIFIMNHPYRFRDQVGSHRFGEASVLIWNPKEFYKRLEIAVKKKGLTIQYGWVSYDIVSEEQFKTGELFKPFHKSPIEFKWENEFRFYVPSASRDEHLTLNLGPINDIACIMEKGMRYELVHKYDDVYEVQSSVDM